jgi:hypothetical protein
VVRGVCNAAEKAFNKDMSGARVSVEWGFGLVVTEFPYVNCEQNMKVFEGPVQAHIENAVLFTNMLTILYGRGNFYTASKCDQVPTLDTH